MKAFLLAIIAVVCIGIGSSIVLESYQQTVDSALVGGGARPDPDPKLHPGPKG